MTDAASVELRDHIDKWTVCGRAGKTLRRLIDSGNMGVMGGLTQAFQAKDRDWWDGLIAELEKM